jgi:hypothetical protein
MSKMSEKQFEKCIIALIINVLELLKAKVYSINLLTKQLNMIIINNMTEIIIRLL